MTTLSAVANKVSSHVSARQSTGVASAFNFPKAGNSLLGLQNKVVHAPSIK